MILKRLFELAERERLLDDPAFVDMPVPLIIKLGPTGEYLGIEERRGEIPLPSRKKNAPPKTKPDRGKVLSVPRPHGNTANVGFACFFVDTLARVLPATDDAKSARSRNTFWQQMRHAATETADPCLAAAVAFERHMDGDDKLASHVRADLKSKNAGDKCTFAWDPDHGLTLAERSSVRNWYRSFYQAYVDAKQEKDPQGLCQVSGEYGSLPLAHATKVAGVPGGLATGVSLVSFDKAAFESYGLQKAANAGIGYRAADGYTRALTALIQNNLTGRPRTSLKVGNILFLFWTREPGDANDLMQLDRPEPAEVARLVESAHRGKLSQAGQPNDFYCLALSGNSARAIVRDYLEMPLPQMQNNLGQWFADLQIIDDSYEQQGQINSCFSINRLAASTAWEADSNRSDTKSRQSSVAPQIVSKLVRAALNRDRLPDSLLSACLRRIRVESGAKRCPAARMALIKVFLNRTDDTGGQAMTNRVDEERTPRGDAYQCGRLLAFLARCQGATLGAKDFGASAPLLDRYFGAASTTPRSVFPTLLRLNRHHLSSIRDQNRGFAFNLERELDGLLYPFKQVSAPTPDFPAILGLPDQGRFALGFYHQRAEYRRKSADRNRNDEQPSGPDHDLQPAEET
jgi:CRISPR-associated protein Csd1